MTDDFLTPRPGECLACFLDRAVTAATCDGRLRWAADWCQAQPLPAGWVPLWLERRGGYCDCEAVMEALDGGPGRLRGLLLRCEDGCNEPATQS